MLWLQISTLKKKSILLSYMLHIFQVKLEIHIHFICNVFVIFWFSSKAFCHYPARTVCCLTTSPLQLRIETTCLRTTETIIPNPKGGQKLLEHCISQTNQEAQGTEGQCAICNKGWHTDNPHELNTSK